jgi:hypothetical protein
MDADDLMMQNRLKYQVQFLKSNPNYGMAGTWYNIIDSVGNIIHEKEH